MVIRTTVGIPELLYERLRVTAKQTGTSIRALIVGAIEEKYIESRQGAYVGGPLVRGKGKLGPAFPVDENPPDLVFF
jgi:hypothetical protein